MLALLLGAGLACATPAQEPTHGPSATQPSRGHFFLKSRVQWDTWDEPGADGSAISLIGSAIAGVTPTVSLGAEWAWQQRERSLGGGEGLRDPRLWAAWRFFQRDHDVLDTTRASLIAGAELPAGSEAIGRDEVAPFAGFALTDVRGRRGLGFNALWQFHDEAKHRPLMAGDLAADHLRLSGSWLWRIAPAEFGARHEAAHYLQLEALCDYETDGGSELRLAPGWLLEAPRWACELSLELPVADDLDARPARSISIIFGLRFLL
jgi:hypothetical protein